MKPTRLLLLSLLLSGCSLPEVKQTPTPTPTPIGAKPSQGIVTDTGAGGATVFRSPYLDTDTPGLTPPSIQTRKKWLQGALKECAYTVPDGKYRLNACVNRSMYQRWLEWSGCRDNLQYLAQDHPCFVPMPGEDIAKYRPQEKGFDWDERFVADTDNFYHKAECPLRQRNSEKTTLENALALGFIPCRACIR